MGLRPGLVVILSVDLHGLPSLSGQLAPLRVLSVTDPLTAYLRYMGERQRLGAIKIPALLPMGADPALFQEDG